MTSHEQRIAELAAELAAMGPAPQPKCDRSTPYKLGTDEFAESQYPRHCLEKEIEAITNVLESDDCHHFLPTESNGKLPDESDIAEDLYPEGTDEYAHLCATRAELLLERAMYQQILDADGRCGFLPLE